MRGTWLPPPLSTRCAGDAAFPPLALNLSRQVLAVWVPVHPVGMELLDIGKQASQQLLEECDKLSVLHTVLGQLRSRFKTCFSLAGGLELRVW